ncbi:amidohydrolase [Aspergillus sclerotioniger CBS 115572]|uniref:Amidohydrolase n=1 Tax=Aspergillus sclerotioniger CBS 115572 TaxID=1450535 RepID=A0A317XFX9_9EURO|nr:amidohydrolase [Aspergillus sclerotioniger CBS 115572]PWY96068.1 amidohydrolase [Aspergillus sclerotioniger CBS 115572]
MNPGILLQGGTLLVHQDDNTVIPFRADILIHGNTIAQIEQNIHVDDNIRIINCSNKIISPGFISTHHHLWQTQLKGKHANQTLLEYLPSGNLIGALYTPADAFWGELSGAMEAIDAGTTCVVDHSSLNIGPEYPPTMIQALETSGLRAIYCQCVPRTITNDKDLMGTNDHTPTTALTTWKPLAKAVPFANDRIQLGFAIDNLYLPTTQLQELYSSLRSMNAKIITSHGTGGISFGNAPSAIQLLHQSNLLGPDILISHANFPKPGDADLLATHGAFVSSTPNTELQMGYPPVAFMPEFEPHASLGVDCHSWGSGFMPYQMRMILQYARTVRSEGLAGEGKWSRHVSPSVEQVFNLGTVGRIRVGAKADLVIFDMTTPAMLVAAQEDPLAAVVLHSSERDVDTVIVDGVVRKEGGVLLPVGVAKAPGSNGGGGVGMEGQELAWNDVVHEVLKSREAIRQKARGIDMKALEEGIIDAFHMDRESMIESA